MNVSIMYRGPLTSCNYACDYCPFAKRTETRSQLQRDRQSLHRFVTWIGQQEGHRFRVLFTPWGEALVRSWYRDAVAALSHIGHLDTVAIQTNLSCGLKWLGRCRSDRLSFWATFHPGAVKRETFVRKVAAIHARGIRVSVGVVAVPGHRDDITALRDELPQDVYVWLNAQQPRSQPYSGEEIALFSAIDPLFPLTVRRHVSRGRPCSAGEVVFTVDGQGNMRRCHFVETVIGNIYRDDWASLLTPRICPNLSCNCYLGFSHLLRSSLLPAFDEGLIARFPVSLERLKQVGRAITPGG